jgi:hypothetical protein
VIVATIVFDAVTVNESWREDARAAAYDPSTLRVIALGLRAALLSGGGAVAHMHDDGVWTSPNPRLASILTTFFGPEFTSPSHVAPLGWPVEKARDAAHAFGARISGELDDEDEPDSVVF